MKIFHGRNVYFLLSFLYCLIFFLIRVLSSSTLSPDEAEQFFYAKELKLSYLNQAPLLTWILHPLFLTKQLNFLSLSLVKYTFFFIFLSSFYLITEQLIDKELRKSCFLSLVFCILYSINFHKDLTHTVLATALGSLTIWLIFKLIKNPSPRNYFLIGLVVSLGLLAKYNLIFLDLGIFLALITDKKTRTLFSKIPELLYFLLALCIPLALHGVGLWEGNFSSIAHASNKAGSSNEAFWSLTSQVRIFSKVLQTLILPSISVIFFKFKFKNSLINKIILFSYGSLLLTLYLTQVNTFTFHWLAPVAFLVPLFLFSNFQESSRTKIFNFIASIFIFLSIAFQGLNTFHPEIFNKSKATHINFKSILEQLNGLYNFEDTIFISNNILILSNLEQASAKNNKIKTLWLEKLSYDHYTQKGEMRKATEEYSKKIQKIQNKKVIILSKQDLKGEELPKRFKKIFGEISYKHKFIQILKMHKNKKFKYYLWEA